MRLLPGSLGECFAKRRVQALNWVLLRSLTNPPDDDEQAALVMEACLQRSSASFQYRHEIPMARALSVAEGDVEQDRKRGEARKGCLAECFLRKPLTSDIPLGAFDSLCLCRHQATKRVSVQRPLACLV